MNIVATDFPIEQKFISVDHGNTLIPVDNVYSFIYESGEGKTVLRISVPEDVMTFDTLKDTFTNPELTEIYMYENVEIQVPSGDDSYGTPSIKFVNIFTNYTKDYTCRYEDGVYHIEITRKSKIELVADQTAALNLDFAMALAGLYETMAL